MTEETKRAIRECGEIADTFSDCDGPPSAEFKRLWPEAYKAPEPEHPTSNSITASKRVTKPWGCYNWHCNGV